MMILATGKRHLAGVDRAGRREFAAIKMKCLDAKHAGIELSILFDKLSQRSAWNIATPSEREMRMPRAQIGLQPDRKRGVLHAFVKLK